MICIGGVYIAAYGEYGLPAYQACEIARETIPLPPAMSWCMMPVKREQMYGLGLDLAAPGGVMPREGWLVVALPDDLTPFGLDAWSCYHRAATQARKLREARMEGDAPW